MMLNFIQGTTGTAVIYADTVSNNEITYTDYFLFAFKSTYSKRITYVYPEIDVRNDRFIQFTVGATGLQEMQNWTYQLWNIPEPGCQFWNLDEDLWNEAETIWNVCLAPTPTPAGGILIDQGQMFLTPA